MKRRSDLLWLFVLITAIAVGARLVGASSLPSRPIVRSFTWVSESDKFTCRLEEDDTRVVRYYVSLGGGSGYFGNGFITGILDNARFDLFMSQLEKWQHIWTLHTGRLEQSLTYSFAIVDGKRKRSGWIEGAISSKVVQLPEFMEKSLVGELEEQVRKTMRSKPI